MSLREIGDARAFDGLLARLADEDDFVRVWTTASLGQIGDKRAVDGLLALLEDEDIDVRARAAWALGEIGDARAVDGLLARLADESESGFVLRAVYNALITILNTNIPSPKPEAEAVVEQTISGPWDA